MSIQRHFILFILSLLVITPSIAHQKPYVINFARDKYHAANKNWTIGQDEKGITYFGNDIGLLEFDGAVLFGRCIPIIRSLISVPAGMARMEMPKFLLFTIIGSTVWNILLVGTGAAVGVAWEQAAGYVKMYADIVFLVLAAGAVCFPAVHLYRKKHK